jgi:hypothetical protein
MGRRQRLNAKLGSVFRRICFWRPEAAEVIEGDDDYVEEGRVRQYRLEATRKVRRSVTCTIRIFFKSLTFATKKYRQSKLVISASFAAFAEAVVLLTALVSRPIKQLLSPCIGCLGSALSFSLPYPV